MAKARDVPLDPFEPYAAAAARVVRVRAQELFDHAEGVLDTEDIERVHAMRVASRRLRAVLEIFAPCFPARPFRSALKDVKALADALGERRDPDVHIDAMERHAAGAPDEHGAGIALLIADQRSRQATGNEVLAAELARAQETDLDGRLQWLADHAETQIPAPAEDDPEAFEAADGELDPGFAAPADEDPETP